jgi:hypothetical protein
VAEIIIHAGMPKTGSTSVQHWLVENASDLRDRHDVHLLVATNRTRTNPGLEVHVEPYESGNVNSGLLIFAWAVDGYGPTVPVRFVDELRALAPDSGRALVTGEALNQLFWRLDEPFLRALDALGREHTVRVAYYVRAQHTAIESWWCEGGFRQPAEPSAAVVGKTRELHYLQTLEGVRALAPNVDFGMRPFRRDLLDRESIVDDFARRFLAINEECPDVRANIGLPLELVNMLRQAPDGMFWNGKNELYPRGKLKAAAAQMTVPESDETRRSRLVLQAFCHETFEAENRALIQQLGWPASEFVARPSELDPGAHLADLDALWQPSATPADVMRQLQTLKDRLDATD